MTSCNKWLIFLLLLFLLILFFFYPTPNQPLCLVLLFYLGWPKTPYGSQAALKLIILLHQPLKYLNCYCILSHWGQSLNLISVRLLFSKGDIEQFGIKNSRPSDNKYDCKDRKKKNLTLRVIERGALVINWSLYLQILDVNSNCVKPSGDLCLSPGNSHLTDIARESSKSYSKACETVRWGKASAA